MKQTNICRLSGDITMINNVGTDLRSLRAPKAVIKEEDPTPRKLPLDRPPRCAVGRSSSLAWNACYVVGTWLNVQLAVMVRPFIQHVDPTRS